MSKYDKKWREENPEKWRESHRKAMKKWRSKNPEKAAACQMRYLINEYPEIAKNLVAQNSTSNNKAMLPCCEEFVNSEYQYCPWCGAHVPGHYSARQQ